MTLTQENRLLSITTPLGEETLLLTGFSGSEGISQPFGFELTLASEDTDINPRDIIGQSVTVSIGQSDDERRYINGIVCRFSQDRLGDGADQEQYLNIATYSATMVPWFWLLTRTVNSRIFQEKTVQQIVEQIFSDREFADYEFRLSGEYVAKAYCVQYHESDFNFISRLFEAEGIFYFFEHEDGRHVLVMADSSDAHQDCPHQVNVRCQLTGETTLETEDVIKNLGWGEEIRFGKYTTKDFNFLMPLTDLRVEMPTRITVGQGDRELYDYPGEYLSVREGERYADMRMQAEEAQITVLSGTSNCRAFLSGFRFTLQEYHRDDMNERPYVLTAINHSASEPIAGSGAESEASYSNSFVCIPHSIPFRPPLMTPKPVVVGVQTALVTGPEGEEIYTNEHGMVKVQFHWDREGQYDENTTCFIRVGQIWAGMGWGAVWLPRIGHEVIVSFIEGDPDRPIIIGSVYNGSNTPPYTLPDDKTKSTVKSESSLGGGGSNEIRFEDKKGEEEVFIHAQKDHNIVVENNRSATITANDSVGVGGNRSLSVSGNETIEVTGSCTRTIHGGETLLVEQGRDVAVTSGETQTIRGGRAVTVEGGDERLTAGVNRIEEVTGNYNLTVHSGLVVEVDADHEDHATGRRVIMASADALFGSTGGDMYLNSPSGLAMLNGHTNLEISSGAGSITITAARTITIDAGGSTISIGPSGITISTGGNITLEGATIKNNC
jgi:type VI secretion system secreted protein VgrG